MAVEHRIDYLLPYITDMIVLKEGQQIAADTLENAAPAMFADPELRPLLPALWQIKLGIEAKLGITLGNWRSEEDALADLKRHGIEGRAD